MNQLKKVIICFVLFLIFPIFASADMGAPFITPYKIRVSNPNGAVLKDSLHNETVTVPYDTVLEVNYEYKKDDVLYGQVKYDNYSYYIINLSDAQLITSVDDIDFSTFREYEQSMYVFKEGAYLYKGPSRVYGKVDGDVEIPVGTIVKTEYCDLDFRWAYVNYNGTKGWVYIFSYQIGTSDDESSRLATLYDSYEYQYTFEDAYLEEDPVNESGNSIMIPKFSKLLIKGFYVTYPGYVSYLVDYNGKTGWYQKPISREYNNVSLLTLEDTMVFGEFRDENSIVHTIPKGVEVNVTYYFSIDKDEYYYISYDGIQGWAIRKFSEYPEYKFVVSTNLSDNVYKQYILDNDYNVYESINGSLTGQVLNSQQKIVVKYKKDEWYYVNNVGWINVPHSLNEAVEDKTDNEDGSNWESVEENEEEISDEDADEIEEDDDEIVENFPKFSILEISLYCIVGAAILSLVTLVTIKLVNKKHQENKNAKSDSNFDSDEDIVIVKKVRIKKTKKQNKIQTEEVQIDYNPTEENEEK